jgi:hypothetical protein
LALNQRKQFFLIKKKLLQFGYLLELANLEFYVFPKSHELGAFFHKNPFNVSKSHFQVEKMWKMALQKNTEADRYTIEIQKTKL